MSSWLPQNIQKRLLLYILQQVSLFSNVDISNLDVSIGSQSHFTFNDLDLDVKELQLPSISIESGRINHLCVQLGVGGNVNISGDGIVFVLKPINDVDEDISEQWASSLTKSVLDLTKSIISSETNTPINDSPADPQMDKSPTTLDSMRNKVLQIALTRLSMEMTNIEIQVLVSANFVLTIKIKQACLTSIDGKRHIDLNEVKLFYARLDSPDLQPERDDVRYSPKGRENENGLDNELADSVTFSKFEAPSFYMSAMESLAYDPVSCFLHPLVNIDTISIRFQGLKSIDDLGVHNLMIKINKSDVYLEAFASIIDPILLLINPGAYFAELVSIDKTMDMKSYKRFKQEQDIQEEKTLSSILINELNIHLLEGLLVHLDDIAVKNSDSTITSISAFNMKISMKDKDYMVVNPSLQPFFYMTLNQESAENRIYLNTDFELIIDAQILPTLCNIWKDTLQAYDKVMKMYKPITVAIPHENQLDFKSSKITITIQLNCVHLQLEISPITSQLPYNIVNAKSVLVNTIKNGKKNNLGLISGFSLRQKNSYFQISSFDTKFMESRITTKLSAIVEAISINISQNELTEVISEFLSFCEYLPTSDEVQKMTNREKILKKSVRLMNSSSLLHKKSVIANFALEISSIKFNILNVLNGTFGSLFLNIGTTTLIQSKNHEITTSISNVYLERTFGSEKANIIAPFHHEGSKPGVILNIAHNGKVKVYLKGMSLLYDAKWLEFASSSGGSSQKKEKASTDIFFEIRLHDCSLVLKPYRLSTCAVFVLSRTIINLHDSEISTSIRSAEILLIDDLKNSKEYEVAPSLENLSHWYEKKGFVHLGKLEVVSLRLKLSETLGVSIKVNKTDLSLCSDSMNAFIQTLIDLKPTITFPDSLKYQFEPYNCRLLEDITNDYFIFQNLKNDCNFAEPDSELVSSSESVYLEESHFSLNPDDRPNIPTEAKKNDITMKIDVLLLELSLKLYDGYDWKHTRKEISSIVENLERRLKKDMNSSEAKIFDSIYISAPSGNDIDIKSAINMKIHNDHSNTKKMKLRPTNKHKVMISGKDVTIGFVGFADSSVAEINKFKASSNQSFDILNKTIVNIMNIEVIDNLPTSTWNKFLSRLKGQKSTENNPMASFEFSLVRPIPYLFATEMLISAKILPLRLHVDQDALDFLTLFFQFKDPRFELLDDYPDVLYIQRFEINSVKLLLDYKPKKVDYVALKSGKTQEFMNFFILDESKINLKHVILYGVNGFSDLENILTGIWTPDITRKQLPGVLSGLGPLKSLIGLGTGTRALVSIPTQEYKQDGRLGRSLQKGAKVFLKTTSGEMVKLAVKLTSGTQAVLENTEGLLGGQGMSGRNIPIKLIDGDERIEAFIDESLLHSTALFNTNSQRSDHVDILVPEDNQFRVISLYADQPRDFQSGIQDAYTSVGHNFNIAYATMKKAKKELDDAKGAQDALSTIAKAAPLALIRPLIGVTEAFSKTLQGLNNQLDQDQSAQLQEKYKSRKPQKPE